MIKRPFTLIDAGDETRGVTSVIGVVLLVAVTVVLAAVIGTFALGTTDNVNEDAPSASFEVVREDVDFSGATYNIVFVRHKYGDDLDADNLHVTVNGKQAWDVAGTDNSNRRTVKPTARADTLITGKKLRLVYWPNNFPEFPLGKGELDKSNSGGCGDVLRPEGSQWGDCTLNDDIVGRDESVTVKIIYEDPQTGKTFTLDTLQVSAQTE